MFNKRVTIMTLAAASFILGFSVLLSGCESKTTAQTDGTSAQAGQSSCSSGKSCGSAMTAEAGKCTADCEKACCAKDGKSCCEEAKAGCESKCPMTAMASKTCSKAGSMTAEHTHQHAENAMAAHSFILTDHNGNKVNLADYKGKIVAISWMNYDCPFDKPHFESGKIQKLASKLNDHGAAFLAINSTNYADQQANKEFADKHNVNFPILIDQSGEVGKKYGATNTPHVFIFDKKGNLAYEGAFDNAPRGNIQGEEYVNYVEKAVTELAEGKEVSIAKTKPYGCSVKYAK